MTYDTRSCTTAFNKLPIELNKAVAHYLPTDRDIANYRHICKATNHAVDGDQLSFWRAKFREKYAFKAGVSNKEMKKKYQRRARNLRYGTRIQWTIGQKNIERKIIGTIKELITESFQGVVGVDEHDRPQCPNQVQLFNFVMNSKILLNGKCPPESQNEPGYMDTSLSAVRLMCAHFLFNLEGAGNVVFPIDESQRAVYASTRRAPIYQGMKKTEINMEWILHCLNFFHHHMTDPGTSSLYNSMQELEVSQKPSAWNGPLKGGSYPLSKYWKGTYAYLEEPTLKKFRNRSKDKDPHLAEIFIDLNVDEGRIQNLQLDFVKEGKLDWPDVFEDRLQSLRETLPARTRAQHSRKSNSDPEDEASKNIMITGWGEDEEEQFYATGWLNPLPDQCGIPGWQRITFMKHFEEDFEIPHQDNLWAYEGVVLPGGRIILGRWWYAQDPVNFAVEDEYGGPFILWAVESEDLSFDENDDA